MWVAWPLAELLDVLDAVLVAQRAGVRAIRPGVSGGEVDDACRQLAPGAGYGEFSCTAPATVSVSRYTKPRPSPPGPLISSWKERS